MRNRERVLVIDYGGQYTHLIARRCREHGVFSRIISRSIRFSPEKLQSVKGVILSGGPKSVRDSHIHEIFSHNLELLSAEKIPILGICFGHQLLAEVLGGRIAYANEAEYGKTTVNITRSEGILIGLPHEIEAWMSHSDRVVELPSKLNATATTKEGSIAAFQSRNRLIHGVQFHPEVSHTEYGNQILSSFLRTICKCTERYEPEDEIDTIVERIRKQVGQGRVLMGTSGGVDSTVAAYLIRQAIGNRLHCVFVDNGLLRKGEPDQVISAFKEMEFENLWVVDASGEFLSRLKGISDPEEKRKAIAETFIRVFQDKAAQLKEDVGKFDFLGQGTIYPDRVESAATGDQTSVIKSHHNVALPDWLELNLVEPLADFYKDEVRQIGAKLGIPESVVHRQPFPGPSLAIRIGGEVTAEKVRIVRESDSILQAELESSCRYDNLWQSFCVLLPVRSVGVMGDERTYQDTVVIRAVESEDAMTASVSRIEWDILLGAASRIINEVDGVNRCAYDITSKPPGTIEWY